MKFLLIILSIINDSIMLINSKIKFLVYVLFIYVNIRVSFLAAHIFEFIYTGIVIVVFFIYIYNNKLDITQKPE